MSFVRVFNELRLDDLARRSTAASKAAVLENVAKPRLSLADFAELLSPSGASVLEDLCRRSQALTQQRFGKVIRLFAPLYLSNECINNCKYCGKKKNAYCSANIAPRFSVKKIMNPIAQTCPKSLEYV